MKARIKILVYGVCFLGILVSCSPKELSIEDGRVIINGSEVYYKIIGEGEPLFVVHGGPVLDHSYFLPHLENLAHDYQLIFYDQRASGRSGTKIDSSQMTLDGFAEDVELLRKQLGFEKINLMGHSWGGLIAMIYATKYSDQLDHLILANSMAPNVIDWQTESAAVAKAQTPEDRKVRQAYIDSLASFPQDRYRLIGEFLKTSFSPQMYDRGNLEKLELYIPNDYDLRSGLTRLLGADISSFNYDSALVNITCPTLLVYGETEAALEIYTTKMLDLIPDSELKVIGESGHFPFIEQPRQFKNVVGGFLNK